MFYLGYGAVPQAHLIHPGPTPSRFETPITYSTPRAPPAPQATPGANVAFGNALRNFGERLRSQGIVDPQQRSKLATVFRPLGMFVFTILQTGHKHLCL